MLLRDAEAEVRVRAVLALYAAIRERRGQANALRTLGDVVRRLNRAAEAEGHVQAALALSAAIGDRRGQAHALHSLGENEQMAGRYSAAQPWFAQAFALYKLIDLQRLAAGLCAKNGHQAMDQANTHQSEGAQELLESAFALAQFLLTTGEELQEEINPNLISLRQRITDFE